MKLLLVEGETDVGFFGRLLRDIRVAADVQIRPPRQYGHANTVTVLPVLLPVLLKQLENGQLSHLGIIADADHTSGGGAAKRWTALTTPLRDAGYRVPLALPKTPALGSLFQHNDGLPPVGLWLMPDHQRDGMLEDLLLETISDAAPQPALLAHARQAVQGLPQTLFSPHQQTKALIYTWLAWQRRPGLGLSVAVDAQLLALQKQPIQGLRAWLERTFA